MAIVATRNPCDISSTFDEIGIGNEISSIQMYRWNGGSQEQAGGYSPRKDVFHSRTSVQISVDDESAVSTLKGMMFLGPATRTPVFPETVRPGPYPTRFADPVISVYPWVQSTSSGVFDQR